MTSVAPPPPPPPPTGNGNAAQLTVTLSPQVSAQFSKLAIDSLISGLIKAPATSDAPTILQSNLGPIPFKAPFSLPNNSQAVFKVVQTTPAIQLQLSQINAKAVPPNTPATRIASLAAQSIKAGQGSANLLSSQGTTQGGLATGNANAPATLLSLNTAQGIKAFVLSSPTNPQIQAQTSNSPVAQTTGQVQSGVPVQSGKGVTSLASPSSTPTTATVQGNQQIPANNPFQPGNQLSVRLISVQTPGQPLQNATPASSSSATTSTVITQGQVQGQTPSGQAIIKIPQGQIALDSVAKFPDGTSIKLEVLSSIKPADKPAVSSSANNPVASQLSQKWPALEEALTTLRETNPGVADTMLNHLLPKPDTRLALNMIFFLKALGRGTFKNWADDKTLRAISRSKPDLLKKLESDFQTQSDKAKQPNSTDWKIAYVPLEDQGKLQQIRIAQRDHREEENDGKDDPGVRFVIDLNLSRLGPMQLDGLAKETNKKFDLIIRTHTAIPGFMRHEIHDIYAQGMNVIGFAGRISFQVTSHFVLVEDAEELTGSLNLGMLV